MDMKKNKKMAAALVLVIVTALTAMAMSGCSSENSKASCRDILDGCKDGEYIYIRNKEKEIDYSIAISENRRE